MRPLLLTCLLLTLTGCERPTPPRAVPLWPELYVIAETDRPGPGEFHRYSKPASEGGGLDIAVTDYVDAQSDRAPVQLVGVVHVADRPYYERIQDILDAADIVLYEAIMPEGMSFIDWRARLARNENGVGGFQEEIAAWFGFQHQLDAVDYSAARFVHADMTVEEFVEQGGGPLLKGGSLLPGVGSSDSMTAKVRDVLGRVRAFGHHAMSRPNALRSLARKMFAEAIGAQKWDGALDMFPGLSDLILNQRNAVVMSRLEEVLPDAQGTVSIFYGAAHMWDLEKRLLALGYRRTGGRWLRAWALRPPL
jgi:hypothetical protein